MPLIHWNDKLSVKVTEIDQQHRKLVTIINELTDAIEQGKAEAIVNEVLSGLHRYAETHFKTEEDYFERFGYPDAEAHRKEHALFIRKVAGFENRTTDGEIRLTIRVLQFLGDWLINHIMVVDKAYSEFFNEKGLS